MAGLRVCSISFVGAYVILSIRSSDLVVLGLPVLKRRSLGLGDPKLSLLRLWGQSSCFFNFGTIRSSKRLTKNYDSFKLYATKSSLKGASSLVSLAGDTPPRLANSIHKLIYVNKVYIHV